MLDKTLSKNKPKNYKFVTVVSKVEQYTELINELNKNNGSTSLDFRRRVAYHFL